MLSAFLARDQRVSMFKSEPLWPSLVRGRSKCLPLWLLLTISHAVTPTVGQLAPKPQRGVVI